MATLHPRKTESKCSSAIRYNLIRLSEPIREALSKTHYNPPEGSNFFIKSTLESLFPNKNPPPIPATSQEEEEIRREVRDFCLCCAALASAEGVDEPLIYWIPRDLSIAAKSAVKELSLFVFGCLDDDSFKIVSDLGSDFSRVSGEDRLVVELFPVVLPLLKGAIKGSSIDPDDEIVASSAKVPVASAILAVHQFRWFVTQVTYPYLGKLCSVVIPCALTALDHWSSEVKGQGMVSFIHLAKNVNAAELGWYEDVILDMSCRNIASSDELWHQVVEMSVLLVTCIQRRNPRSSWYEKLLSEMLGHLERQPRNKERRIEWLQLIEPIFNAMGIVLLAHFRRIFPLFFQWMHADDDRTVVLVLERACTIIKLTWIRNTPYVERLVDELILVYKESSMRKDHDVIRKLTLQILVLLHQCKGVQFQAAWDKHKDDPNLTLLASSIGERDFISVVQ